MQDLSLMNTSTGKEIFILVNHQRKRLMRFLNLWMSYLWMQSLIGLLQMIRYFDVSM